jgi:hypothetical protein
MLIVHVDPEEARRWRILFTRLDTNDKLEGLMGWP